MKTVFTKTLALMTGSFLLAACGSSPGAENDGRESASEALIISPIRLPYDCETMAPNASANIASSDEWYDADIAAPYGSIFCPASFVVQVTGAYAAEIGGVVTAQVGPAKAASESECASTTASLTLYGSDGAAWASLGTSSVAGRWVNGTPGTLIETGCYFGAGASSPGALQMGTETYYATYRAVGSVSQNGQQVAMAMGVGQITPPK